MKVFISARARADLFEIEEYIARANPARSVSFVAELIERIAVTGERPLSFPNWSGERPDIRIAHHRRYRIIFRVHTDHVAIERVLHGARNVDALLDELK
ncbi:MAG TPA: type II toxin-antitoxin system RelE/ParE family toxin [Qipengyuania sp.]|nr:type II toxin-antitoxin system RelE/ParE family toxin [Qipengyuania sp.]